MKTRQDTLFKNFQGKLVKIRFRDGLNDISTARGILLSDDGTFLLLKGDYNKFCIKISSIEKISSQVKEEQDDNKSD